MEEGINIKFFDIILINLILEFVILLIMSKLGVEWKFIDFE